MRRSRRAGCRARGASAARQRSRVASRRSGAAARTRASRWSRWRSAVARRSPGGPQPVGGVLADRLREPVAGAARRPRATCRPDGRSMPSTSRSSADDGPRGLEVEARRRTPRAAGTRSCRSRRAGRGSTPSEASRLAWRGHGVARAARRAGRSGRRGRPRSGAGVSVLQPRGGELERERRAVQPRAHRGDRGVGVRRRARGPAGRARRARRTARAPRRRAAAAGATRARRVSPSGSRLVATIVTSGQPATSAAGDVGGGIEHVLAVVEAEQQAAVGELRTQRVRRCPARGRRARRAPRPTAVGAPARGRRRRRAPPTTSPSGRRLASSAASCAASRVFPAPAEAGDGHQPGAWQPGVQLGQLRLAADEARRRGSGRLFGVASSERSGPPPPAPSANTRSGGEQIACSRWTPRSSSASCTRSGRQRGRGRRRDERLARPSDRRAAAEPRRRAGSLTVGRVDADHGVRLAPRRGASAASSAAAGGWRTPRPPPSLHGPGTSICVWHAWARSCGTDSVRRSATRPPTAWPPGRCSRRPARDR